MFQAENESSLQADYNPKRSKLVIKEESTELLIPMTQAQLQIACEHNKVVEAEKILDEHPELLSKEDIKGNTPLMTAIKNNAKEMVLLLLSCGECRLDHINIFGENILHFLTFATVTKEDEMMHLLAKKLLEEYPFFINYKNKGGETPLHLAVQNNNVEIAKMLIGKGAKKEERNVCGYTPVDYAVFYQRDEIVELLKDGPVVEVVKETEEKKEVKVETKDLKETELKTPQPNQSSEKQETSFFNLFKRKENHSVSPQMNYRKMVSSLVLDPVITSTTLDSFNAKKKFRMISIDGGGSKCILQSLILARLVKKFPELIESTNLFCGVSAGSFVCADLAMGIRPADVAQLMIEMSKHMFQKKSRGYTEALYSNEYIIDVAHATFGDKKLSDLKRGVLVNSFQFDTGKNDPKRSCKACVFNNFIPGYDCKIADATLRSSAAVGYFPPYDGGYADGGIFENNPSVCAFPFVFGERGLGIEMKNTVCLSLSSGRPPVSYIDSDKYTDVGMLQLLPICMDGFFLSRKAMADVTGNGFLGERYFRFDPVLFENLDLDCADAVPKIIQIGETVDLAPIEDWIVKYWL
ncbi:ankyrin repeat-containing protein, putative [Entamoeba invadens IP1]|uniref:phospholipase A2 n=1 Tax=Entamoeba invadens IP1 TaxID=370355 RepID=A0A0A1TY27_ENTIV|nr:ankyrin repeat-containing protein, putative [Entamoeba invadens IP1]ELP86422.1 ankyrin repeat-containing protein, putative [Entamoeba invadens IP1]|eukprot:XP_004185768.1 ankyrin repeat-containing protein, putative [Entamoeba invadens IP1]